MNLKIAESSFDAINAAGPLIARAYPGSGRNHTMINRINRLINEGIPAVHIFTALSTKKSANEFSERLNSTDTKNKHVNTLTILTLAARILRDTNYDLKVAQKSVLMNWARNINSNNPSDVLNRVSNVRCANIGDASDKELAVKYTAFLKEKGVTDMDGIILLATPLVAAWAKTNIVKVFIVDEFQDTNLIQQTFIRKIVQETCADFCAWI